MPILDRKDAATARYEEYTRNSRWANATQDIRWASVKSNWDSGQVYLERGGEIVAAMSLIFMKAVGGHTLAYAPRGPVCDPEDITLVRALIDEAKPLLREKKAFVLRLDPEILYDETLCARYARAGFRVRNRGLGKLELIQPRYNMFLDIKGKSFETLMPEFSEKTRYNIRLSQRKGVTVEHSREDWALDAFYDLYRTTCERDRIGARPRDYFRRMLDAYGEDTLRIYLTRHEGDILSGAIAICYGRKMWYIYGASGNEKRNLMPNYAMQAAMIEWGIERGREIYDFGGVFVLDKTNGLYKFKEGFCHATGETELIGEFDLVLDPLRYGVFTRVIPKIQELRSAANHRKRQ